MSSRGNLNVPIPAKTKRAAKEEARVLGMSLSEYVRRCLLIGGPILRQGVYPGTPSAVAVEEDQSKGA